MRINGSFIKYQSIMNAWCGHKTRILQISCTIFGLKCITKNTCGLKSMIKVIRNILPPVFTRLVLFFFKHNMYTKRLKSIYQCSHYVIIRLLSKPTETFSHYRLAKSAASLLILIYIVTNAGDLIIH